uniref:Uncharacterized protein n=1 Tax=Amorphochlora amoebiformis TaxID=1561963 RepID=A0A7S0DJN2_9EUKA
MWKESSFRRRVVQGSFEGLCVSTAVVTVLSATSLSDPEVFCISFGIILPLSLGFAVREWINHKTEYDHYNAEREREEWELENYAEGERKEMIALYQTVGLSKSDAEIVVRTFAKYKKQFIDLMMLQELQMTAPEGKPLLTALAQLIFFTLAALVPILGYATWLAQKNDTENREAGGVTTGLSILFGLLGMLFLLSGGALIAFLERHYTKRSFLLFIVVCLVGISAFVATKPLSFIQSVLDTDLRSIMMARVIS